MDDCRYACLGFQISFFPWGLVGLPGLLPFSFVWSPVRTNPTKVPLLSRQLNVFLVSYTLIPKRRFPFIWCTTETFLETYNILFVFQRYSWQTPFHSFTTILVLDTFFCKWIDFHDFQYNFNNPLHFIPDAHFLND